MNVTQTACQIERLVKRGEKGVGAVFEVHIPARRECSWIACVAVIAPWGEEIKSYDANLNRAHAAALATALQMAVDWLAEESLKAKATQ